jgi:hypothetical protein
VGLVRHARGRPTADPNDNPVIQTALSGKADSVLTADKAMLALGKVRDVEIIPLAEFVTRLPPEECTRPGPSPDSLVEQFFAIQSRFGGKQGLPAPGA